MQILSRTLVLGAALAAGGCALLPSGGEPTAGPGGAASAMREGLRDWRVAFHCHSYLSHDSQVPFDRIAAAARRMGFDAVVLADHYRPENVARQPHGAWDSVLFIPGAELRPRVPGDPEGSRGSLLVFGMDRDFDDALPSRTLIEGLRPGGALAAAAHAEERREWDEVPLDAFEVYNLHAQFAAAGRLSLVFRLLFLPRDRFYEGAVEPFREVLGRWDHLLASGRRLAAIGGHDAHENIHILGATMGAYPDLLRLFSTHVLAPSLDARSLLDGVRRGRTYVSFDFLGDGTGFAMTYGADGAGPGGGPARAILGEEAPFVPGALLVVRAPADSLIRVLLDGTPWREARGTVFSAAVPRPGVYRSEVSRGPAGKERLWIISSPIYIREGKA